MFLYLHGFASSPASAKAQVFRRRFDALGIPLVIPALDEGDFAGLTLSKQRALVERLLAGAPRPHVIIGSSMGGYLALLHAATHDVDAVSVMAPAVDFAARWHERIPVADMARWQATDRLDFQHYGYATEAPLRYDFVRDLDRHEAWPRVSAPVLVSQGLRDDVVHPDRVRRWAAMNPSARLTEYDSGHELVDVVERILDETIAFLGAIPAVRAAAPGLAR